MNCDEVLCFLDALADDELSSKEAITIKSHLRTCPDCELELRQIQGLRDKLQQIPRYPAPSTLPGKIQRSMANFSGPPVVSGKSRWMFPVLSHIAAALFGAVVLYGLVIPRASSPPTSRDIVAAHVRSLVDRNGIQIASSDTHTVGPWFAGKLDYAPPVPDLEAEGFPLLGGRIDFLADKKIAALVYLRRRHRINLFLTPRSDSSTVDMVQQKLKGFNIIGLQDADFTYWAISDVREHELTTFINLVVNKP